MSDEKVTFFGLWITGHGWIRNEKKDDTISFDDYSFAVEAANIIGAKVRRIDKSWKELEVLYLARDERDKGKSLWLTFKNLFAYKKHS